MKNLKVFIEVKKFVRIFYTRKCTLRLVSCLFTEERENEFYIAFENVCIFFFLVLGRAGLGPPNRYRQ